MSLDRFKGFLGCGWSFAPGIDQNGGIASSWHEENVEQNIRIILGTAPGERQMRPDFGCKIHDLVFKPNNRQTANRAEQFVRMAISKWEPRIGTLDVSANPDRYEENTLRVQVTYSIRTTNTTHNLVYPFYLQGQENSE
jgi:phage baseplate assembly protein W